MDALLPQEIAKKAEAVGADKARMPAVRLFALAVLAGAFIAFGAIFYAVVQVGAVDALPWGVARLLGGLAFALGLVLIVVGGAELFTGNTLMVMALAARRLRLVDMIRAWAIVYAGNFVGAAGTAALLTLSGQYRFADGAMGDVYLAIAAAKVALPAVELFFLAVLCNVLVCLAVWLTLGAHSTADKILAVILPIAAFVAAGFEHSVANMFFLPLAGMIATMQGGTAIGIGALLGNLAVVTAGNIVGGGALVGTVYWFVYLRGRADTP